MRLFAQPVLDASAAVSSTSKLCHMPHCKWPRCPPRQSNFALTKLLAFRNRIGPNLHFAEAKLPHRSQ
jgi:hypothetical protein